MTTPRDTGGQQPSQTSAEAGGSIRDRLSAPGSSKRDGADSRESGISDSGFQQGDSQGQLKANGRTDSQHSGAAGVEASDELSAPRREDVDPRAAKTAERKVAALFVLSFLSVIAFVVWYVVGEDRFAEPGATYFTPLLGVFMALALFGVGAGAVLWAKLLMVDEESVQERHPLGSPADERAATAQAIKQGLQETGLPRRPLLMGTLALGAGALAVLPIPLLFGLGRFQNKEKKLATTAWEPGMRLLSASGTPVRVGDLQLGSVESVFPDVEGGTHSADSPALLIRMRPEELRLTEQAEAGAYEGHVVYSSICTHLGCPVKLYEQTTHHLLCPCHQSTFDASTGAEVIFGPAARPLPQLAISVDPEGYFVAQGDFAEPIGASYWERT